MAGTATTVSSQGTNWVDTMFEKTNTVFRANNVMGQIVTRFADTTGNHARANSTYNQLSAGSIAEDTDLTSEAEFTTANIATLTPYERGAISFLTDTRRENDPTVYNDLGNELGQAMADKVESDLLGTFGSLTGGTISTGGGTALTWGHLTAARTVLKSSKVPGPYIAVIHENAWHQLAKVGIPSSTAVNNVPDSLKEAVKSSWYVGQFGDLAIFTTANIAAGTLVTQGVFNPQAIAIDWRRALRLEPQRDASRRGYELNVTARYAAGIWRPKAGVQLKSDASAPTS